MKPAAKKRPAPKAKKPKAAKGKQAPAATKRRVTKRPATKKPRVSTHPMKVRSPETLALTDRLRAICMALPEVTEQIAWGEYTWRAPKIFAMTDTYHHGSAHFAVHLPAPPGAQEALVDAEPARFFRPPYTGGKGWVGVVLDTDPDWGMVESLVKTAYDLIR